MHTPGVDSANAAQEAERVLLDLLEQGLQVSSVTCDAVLNAWALQSSLEAAERAQLILERLEALKNDKIQPTVHSYSTVMNAYAKCGAAEKAHAILHKLLNSKSIHPDTVMFNVVIHAWATSGDPQAGTQAVALLRQMQELASKGYETAPDIVTYNSVLSAWSKSGHVNAGPQAERILKQAQDEHVKPNVVSYNSVLHAWSKSPQPGAAARAQAVLDYMIGTNDIAPDVYSFTSVLNAWAKSKERDKAVRARELLDKFLEMHTGKMSAVPFNAVLNACAFSSESQREALKIAVSTYRQVPTYASPDTITYGNLLKCCANLMPQGKTRTEMAMLVFKKCCEDGLVGDLVWNEVRKAVPSHSLYVPNHKGPVGTLKVRDLPRSWRTNARDKQAAAAKRRKRQSPTLDKGGGKPTKPIRPMRNIIERSYESGRDV